MAHRYFPHTQADIDEMLERCGITSPEQLYDDVPQELRLKNGYQLPSAMTEKEVRDYFNSLGAKNTPLTCFAGGGFYHRYTPSVIPAILSRSEFLTSYTPYQPEISQGTLQYIFEYQSMMAELTGLDVSNASMYDGATATAVHNHKRTGFMYRIGKSGQIFNYAEIVGLRKYHPCNF